jgi:hypothetical protein
MLNIALPKTHYNTADYPSLEERADGAPVPIAYGAIADVVPVCINTSTQVYQLAGHAIHDVTEVRTPDGVVLVLNTDYTLNAGKNQLTLLATPYLAANTTYYIVVEADYAVSGSDYLRLVTKDAYANGQVFSIDGSDVWTGDAGHDLMFKVYGKESLGGSEAVMVNNGNQPNSGMIALRNAAARTRLAQSFKTPASKSFYVTRIQLFVRKTGAPSGSVRVAILSAYTPAEVQVGIKSTASVIPTGTSAPRFIAFPQRATDSGLVCDIEGAEKSGAAIVDGADLLEDLVVTRLEKSSSILDAAALADFKANRTQAVKAYVDRDTTFGDILGKLESSLLFKFVPLHDGTYAPTVYAAGEPAGTPHFFDEHYLSFSMRRDFSAVKSIVKVKYDENPSNQEFKVSAADSNVARFVYGTEETQEVETCLADGTEAAALAASYLGMYETPPLEVTFEIRGYGLNLVPGKDKVKLTRTHAAYAGGTLAGVLFRITKLTKRPATASTEIVCVLDTQTY